MKISILTTLFSMVFLQVVNAQTITVNPNDQTDIIFHEGYVLVKCGGEPDDTKASTELFSDSYIKLMPELKRFSNEGKLVRAHYLGELKSGVFMVVTGSDRDKARENAKEIVQVTSDIIKDSMVKINFDENFEPSEACSYIEIGPLLYQ